MKLDDLETNQFVLVHGGGFGAWCWYKTIALLEEGGFRVTAIDLTGSWIHSFDTNSITSLSQYVKPLTDFLENLADGEKVFFISISFPPLLSFTMLSPFSVPNPLASLFFILWPNYFVFVSKMAMIWYNNYLMVQTSYLEKYLENFG